MKSVWMANSNSIGRDTWRRDIHLSFSFAPGSLFNNPFFIKGKNCAMSEVVQCSVAKEYAKNKNVNPEIIQELRDWIMTQPHLPHEHISDMDLILAYHSCGFDVELTKKGLDLNCTLRTMFTFYQNRKVDYCLKQALNCWLVTPLSTATNKGYRPIYCQLLDPDPNKFVYSDVVKAFIMIVDLCLHEEGTLQGIAVLLNMDKVSLNHLSRVDLTVAQQFFYFIQEAMFVRLKEFHFINAPSFMDKLMSMFKPFMKENMLHIVHAHQAGSNTLNEYLPIAALPKDAGGEDSESTILKDNTWFKIEANDKFFKEDSKKIVNECVRPGGPKNMSTIFPSLDGSFKKLAID